MEKSPCLREFWEERCLPSSVRGPVDGFSDWVMIPRVEEAWVAFLIRAWHARVEVFEGGVCKWLRGGEIEIGRESDR